MSLNQPRWHETLVSVLSVPGSEPGLTDDSGITWCIRRGCLRKVRHTEPVLNSASSLERIWVTVQKHNKQQNLYGKEGMGPTWAPF